MLLFCFVYKQKAGSPRRWVCSLFTGCELYVRKTRQLDGIYRTIFIVPDSHTYASAANKKATRNECGWQIVLVVGDFCERLNDSSVSFDSRISMSFKSQLHEPHTKQAHRDLGHFRNSLPVRIRSWCSEYLLRASQPSREWTVQSRHAWYSQHMFWTRRLHRKNCRGKYQPSQ